MHPASIGELAEFKGLVAGILADDEVNYKEAYQLLYWLEDHAAIAAKHKSLFITIQEFLADDYLDEREAAELRSILRGI